ncbi:MAG: hypothetical protein LUE93_10900 [Bacteroides sp.]|nr:hypothetical protein [Bacteroides sp.]
MNKIFKFLSSLLLIVTAFVSCTPEEYSLGKADISPSDLVEGIAFSITHDSENPNIVYLKSLINDSKYTFSWIHPQGTSQEQEVTLRIAFEGTYPVVFGVDTRAGIIYGDTAYFTIDRFYADFVSDELWTNLTGGVGNAKTWIFDNGNYGMASGEVAYQDPAGLIEFNNFETNWAPNAGVTDDDKIWSSYMIFSLDNGANIQTHNEGWKDEAGTFLLDTDKKTLTITGADLIHPEGWDNMTPNWSRDLKILTLTEDQLQIAILRDPGTSGEDEWWLIWNYVSKEYADNYVPDETDPELPYDGDANEDLTTSQSTTKNWIINLDAPYNWTDLYGNFLNEWTMGAGGIPEFTTWQPPYDEALLSTVSITLSKGGSDDGTYEIIGSDGREYSGNYTIDEKNWIDFGQDIDIISDMDWINFSTQDGKLRIISVERNLSGAVSVMHLGRVNDDNPNEYMTIGLTQGSSSGGGSDNGSLNGTVISFDNSKLVYGDLEGNGTLRLEICNMYGSTASNPGFNLADFQYDYTIQVTFTLSGVSFNSGAAGSYTGALSFASEDWNAQYWGGGAGDTVVTGDGTYTVWCQPGTGNGIAVFCIDISGMADDIDLSAVSATINKIEIK